MGMLTTVNRVQGTRPLSKRRARAYRYRLIGLKSWQVYIGPVRNREEATRALYTMFSNRLVEVRVHPVSDPWPRTRTHHTINHQDATGLGY